MANTILNPHWNPAQYNKFKTQRAKPFFDLLDLIQPDDIKTGVDLGCGTGELTRTLFDRLHPAQLAGIDSSAEMLAKSDEFKCNGLTFAQQDIASYQAATSLDLLFSNAALQWVPHHESLFPRLLSYIGAQGQVAIQMPFNFDHSSHVVARRIGAQLYPDKFKASDVVSSTLTVERYAEILYENGFTEQVCRVEVYGHPMSSGNEVIEWVKGTLLTAYQQQLSIPEFQVFLHAYRSQLLKEVGEGPYFYAFKRILLWGRKAAS